MYQESAASDLYMGNADDTRAVSAQHQSLNQNSLIFPGGRTEAGFHFACYASGGSIGGHHHKFKSWAGVSTFKDQVKSFKGDFDKAQSTVQSMANVWGWQQPASTLFFV
jgi:hypothetical protein